MPTYEYACKDCGEHLEVVQSFRDDALTVCPNCQGELRKVFSAAGIIFKGSGWHIKDYKDSGKPAASASGASKDSKDGTDTASKDTAKESSSSDTSSSSSSDSSSSSSDSGGEAKSA